MFIDLTEEQQALRDELRDYFRGCLTAGQRDLIAQDPFGGAYMEHCRRLGRRRDARHRAPGGVRRARLRPGGAADLRQRDRPRRGAVPDHHAATPSRPTLVQYGTEAQRKRFLPRILAGECHFAIGYSEPGAGTDLAALRTTAVRDGDHYVVNGQKIFTSGAHHADHIWLAVRTDPEARKHKGISMLIADCSDPGFSWTPIITMDGRHHTNSTYYQDVRVPARHARGRGEPGLGPHRQPAQPRAGHARPGGQPRPHLRPVRPLGAHQAGPRRAAADRGARRTPRGRRQVHAYLRINELLNWQVAANMDLGWLGAPDASATKIYGSERMQDAGRIVGEALARYGDPGDEETRDLIDRLDRGVKGALVLTFGGGVNEIQREIIAMIGLGLPRAPR